MRFCLNAVTLPALAVVAFSGVARADIVGLGGDVVIANPPADITLDQWESDTLARIWAEQTVTLASALDLDAVNTGLVEHTVDLVPGQVAAGMTVESFMLRSDPVTSGLLYVGFVQFDQPIVGVQVLRGLLNESDTLLGRAGIQYNRNQFRGLELTDTVTDFFTISADRLRIDFNYSITGWTDDIRIVTAVPAPGSTLAALLAATTLLPRRRRG